MVTGAKKSDRRNEIRYPFSVFWDSLFILVCKNTGGMWAQGVLSTSMRVPRLTCEHEIPEIGELVDDDDRHFET